MMNKEIGGYIELDTYTDNMLYDSGMKLNCGRCALEYIIRCNEIKKIWYPRFMCNSNDKILTKYNVEVAYYSVGDDFLPKLDKRIDNEWIYIVNYYGQINNDYIKQLGKNVILDNTQAYFCEPIENVSTIYSCRKFFGVSDGAILFTNKKMTEELEQDVSYERMKFLLGRFEGNASDFYELYMANNELFNDEKLKMMSKLTENLLHGIDYNSVCEKRSLNFEYLHSRLGNYNKLRLSVPRGAFMYPFYVEKGNRIRVELIKRKIYVPMLWPEVLERDCTELERNLAENILPLPIDQRYGVEEMEYVANQVVSLID